MAKQLCHRIGRRFVPLRSASVTSMLAAVRQLEPTAAVDVTD